MSENLKIIEKLYLYFKEKDYESFKLICDENITWRQNPGFPNGGRYIGAKEVVENVFRSFDQTWKDWKFSIESYHDAGSSIIVTGQYEGKNIKTGKKFTSEAAHIYTLRNGKIIAFQQYADTKAIWDAMG